MTALPVRRLSQQTAATSRSHVGIEVHRDLETVRPLWQAFQEQAVGSPHQTFEWVQTWLHAEARNHLFELCVVVGRDSGGACRFLLPFVVHTAHGYAVLEWAGGQQGNYECGFFARETGAGGASVPFEHIWPDILAALPPIDAVHLACQPTDLDGQRNPLLALPHVPASDPGHAFPLDRDWQKHYETQFSATSRRELRRCERRLADTGDLVFSEARSTADRRVVFRALQKQKRERFSQLGIPDFLANEGVETFFHALFEDRADAGSFVPRVFSLRCGDQILAANIGVRFQDTFYGLLASTTNTPIRRFAPGNILFLKIVAALAEDGITRFDCGAGEDAHKLRWCTERRNRFHTLIPITLKGQLYARLAGLKVSAKRSIKRSPRLWSLAKDIRRLKARLAPREQLPAS